MGRARSTGRERRSRSGQGGCPDRQSARARAGWLVPPPGLCLEGHMAGWLLLAARNSGSVG